MEQYRTEAKYPKTALIVCIVGGITLLYATGRNMVNYDYNHNLENSSQVSRKNIIEIQENQKDNEVVKPKYASPLETATQPIEKNKIAVK